ncbi:MAG: Type 1 glutamine amidotransferase-like domain-containing protein [Candidatus Aminicenantes bacterium]|nr:Type 1 glutamine amidotransferase-like domain-containing protein [Candidatus Aminicenantes bacterium]
MADIVLIAGGRESRSQGGDPLLARTFSLLGLDKPLVAYIGAASHDNRVFFMWIKTMLRKAGAGNVRLAALAAARADLAKARSLLQGADVVFVSGGDVEAGMQVLERTGADSWLRELHRAGKPFIGLSAGSIMLARNWVRWPDTGDDASAEIFSCLGLAPLLCDTHAEKEGWEELQTLLRLSGLAVGHGIPAGAALRIKADGSLSAMGKSVPRFQFLDGRLQRLADLEPA